MTSEWSLDVYYKGLDDPKLAEDTALLEENIRALNAVAQEWQEADAPDEAAMTKKAVLAIEALEETADRLMGYLGLRQAADTGNAEVNSRIGVLENTMTKASRAEVILQKKIAGLSDPEAVIASDPLLTEYGFYLREIIRSAKHMLSDDAEEMITLMNLSGGGAWSKMSDYLTASVKVPYDGRVCNLSEVRNLRSHKDRAVRKAAFEAELAAYPQIEDPMAFALNNIKSQVSRLAEKRGYASVLDMTLEQSRMKRETLEAMLAAIVKYLPKFHAYMRAKAAYLGVGERLAWYDLYAPVGDSGLSFTKEEAKDYLMKSFAPFSQDMADMMGRAFDESWIDFDPRPGKVGGAFCAGVWHARQSRILTNFDGSFEAVDTLAHELGHAYHNLHTEDHRILNQGYPMQVAETASTFNETHIMWKAIGDADGEARLALLDSLLAGTTEVICDIYSRFLFEKAVIDNCQSEFMMPERLGEIMKDTQRTAYGDGLDEATLHPYMWVCKSHYYSEHLSFYNFPYAFGQLFAMGLYARYLKEGAAFVPEYQALLHATPVKTVEEAAAMAGIDVTTPAFWEESLQAFADKMDEFIRLTEKQA